MIAHQYGKFLLYGFVVIMLSGCKPAATAVVEHGHNVKLQEFVKPFYINKDFSGVIAVSQHGKITGEVVFGFADFDRREAIGLHTSFHIASITKTFTATAIRHLMAQQQVSLDDPLAKYLPNFPNAGKITIAHLLEHTSGVPDYWALPDVSEYSAREISLGELAEWLGPKPLDYEPGSDNAYSNSGYALLAAVIEQASGQKYHDYLAQHVYPLAGLMETGEFRNDADALGYSPAYGSSGIGRNAAYDPSILVGAGSLKSTASDLLAWCEAFNADFLNQESPIFLYGWGARNENNHRHAEQSGRNPGFSAHIRAYPDSNTCVVVLSNIESESVSAIGAGVAAIAFNEKAIPPLIRSTYMISEAELTDFVGRFEIFPGNVIEVKNGMEGLLLKGQIGSFLPLEAIGEDEFFYRQLYTSVGVERDPSGTVTALMWGGTYRMPRVE